MWLWMVSIVAGSLFRTATSKWFSGTTVGIWCYTKFDLIADWATDRFGVDIIKDKEELMWRSRYPKVAAKMDRLELRIIKLERK